MRRHLIVLAWACLLLLPTTGTASDFVELDMGPFRIRTDVGISRRERQRTAVRFARNLGSNMEFLMDLFELKPKDLNEFARFYGSENDNFKETIYIHIWSNYQEFLADLQKRYQTQAIAGGYQGIIYPRDSEGNRDGPGFREIGVHMEGISEEEVLRILYHEMSHLMVKTYLIVPIELVNWLDEGLAQLLQFRPENGTRPEAARLERLAWLYEMLHGEEEDFIEYPSLQEIMEVRNAHNLDFTWKNPLRSRAQYTMVYGLTQFLVHDPRAARAFKIMLERFRSEARGLIEQRFRAGRRDSALFEGTEHHLYSKQHQIITEAFNTDLETIDRLWRTWIENQYQREERRRPEMLFYRALYHARQRGRAAPDRTWYQRCLKRAEELLTELEERDPEDALVDVGRGLIAAQNGDWSTAVDFYRAAREKGSDRLEVLIYGAGALIREGRAEDAVRDLEKGLKEAPGMIDGQIYLGQALLITGRDYKRAGGLLRHAASNRPERHDLASWAGLGLMLAGEDQDAFFQFAAAYQGTGMQDWRSAAFIVLLTQRGEIERDQGEWIGRTVRADADMGAKVRDWVDAGKTLQPGFSPEGELGFVGIDLDPETAIVPPDKPRRRSYLR